MYEYFAKVMRVLDGDTIDVEVDLGLRVYTKTRLRFMGIDAPRLNTTEGRAAHAYLQERLPVGTGVIVMTEKDRTEKYGRWLAQVHLVTDKDFAYAEKSLNEEMVEMGHASYRTY